MASARINYNRNSELGSRIQRAVGNIVQGRKDLSELARILDKYLDGTADISADSGISVTDVALVRNLVAQASAELASVNIVAVGVGQASGARQLADAMG